MRLIFRRGISYSSVRLASRLGLRLLDYPKILNSRDTLSIPTKSSHLMHSNAGFCYNDSEESRLESATILYYLFTRSSPNVYERVRDLLASRDDFPPLDEQKNHWTQKDTEGSIVLKTMEKHGLKIEDIQLWIDCWQAPTVEESLELMKAHAWPNFLLLYTFNRKITGKREAYELIRVYQEQLPLMKEHYQLELTWLAIHVAQTHVKEMLAPICRIFVRTSAESVRTSRAFNELLWKLAGFNTTWSSRDAHMIAASQKILIDYFTPELLDRKGYISLAYAMHFDSPELARKIASRAPSRSKSEKGLPYYHGGTLIKLLTSSSFEESLTIMNQVPKEDQTGTLWASLLSRMVQIGSLTDEIAQKLWRFWQSSDAKINSQAVGTLLLVVRHFRDRERILSDYISKSKVLKLTFYLMKCLMGPVASEQEFDRARLAMSAIEPDRSLLVQFMRLQSRWDRENIWSTYQRVLEYGEPCDDSLTSLCIAASDPTLMWDGLYAPQRAFREFQNSVRGFNSNVDDVTAIFPSDGLVHWYIRMLGKANYQEEIDVVLTRLAAIGFRPSKKIYCALISASNKGHALKALAVKAEGRWPSEEERRLYNFRYP